MLIIPSIDLRRGKCVRLLRGEKEREKVYSEDPVEVARKWVKEGAKRLHIVDLDGAFSGKPCWLEVLKKIKEVTGAVLQFGGGIRSISILREVFEKGADYGILGTCALSPPFVKEALSLFGERIIVSLDLKGDRVVVEGWEKDTGIRVQALWESLYELGVRTFILTQVERDGTLLGVDIPRIKRLLQNLKGDLLISGGVSSPEDLKKLASLTPLGLKGVIVGKALYEGRVNLGEFLD